MMRSFVRKTLEPNIQPMHRIDYQECVDANDGISEVHIISVSISIRS